MREFEFHKAEYQDNLVSIAEVKKKLTIAGNRLFLILIFMLINLVGFLLHHRYMFLFEYNNHFENSGWWRISTDRSIDLILLVSLYSLTAIAIFFLVRFRQLRRIGFELYNVITDQIDWSSKRRQLIHQPNTETKVLLRHFLDAADLPYTTGANGQFLYLLVIFVICIIATTYALT